MEIISEVPGWVYGAVYLMILLLCVMSALGTVHSSYAEKRSLPNVIIRTLLVSAGMTVFAFLALGFTLFIQEYLWDRVGFFVGMMSMLILPFLLLGAVYFVPRLILNRKAARWCAAQTGYCIVRLEHQHNYWDAVKSRGIMPVSVDGVPIDLSAAAVVTSDCLYILPGEHKVEFVVFSATRMPGFRRSVPVPHEQGRTEKTWSFVKDGVYICQVQGNGRLSISLKGTHHEFGNH